MKFSDYLKSKRKFLIIWFVLHGFALFVNVFHIEGEVIYKYNLEQVSPNWAHVTDKYVCVFTSHRGYKSSSSSFWPFSIEFTKNGDTLYFPGVFYKYDYSEFIAYLILTFVFFYFLWEKESKNKIPSPNQ